MTPPHTLALFDKPAQGNGFLRRYRVLNYRHKIAAIGGFDSASCDIGLSFADAERFLEQMLGNRVSVYVDNPAAPIWEGYINRITFEYGPIVYTASLEEMTNRVRTTWNNGTQQQTSVGNTAASQAIYGIKEASMDMAFNAVGAGGASADAVRDLTLSSKSWPQTSSAAQGGGGQALVRLELLGFYHTLEWSIYQQGTSAAVAFGTLITTVVTGDPNGTTFYDNTDTSGIGTIPAITFNQRNESGMSRWQFIQQIVEAGDGTNRWVIGIGPTDFNTGLRTFYYQQADPVVRYTTRLREGAGRIRNLYGKFISPWEVRPDGGLRVNDALIGWNLQGDDPRQVYLETIDYDAERGQVSYQSSDDLTLEGSFRIKKMFKRTNVRFGAPIRGSY